MPGVQLLTDRVGAVTSIRATDVDLQTRLTYSISGGNSIQGVQIFVLTANTQVSSGSIPTMSVASPDPAQVANGILRPDLDHEIGLGEVDLLISVTDNGFRTNSGVDTTEQQTTTPMSVSAGLKVYILDINEPPEPHAFTGFVREDAIRGTVIPNTLEPFPGERAKSKFTSDDPDTKAIETWGVDSLRWEIRSSTLNELQYGALIEASSSTANAGGYIEPEQLSSSTPFSQKRGGTAWHMLDGRQHPQ